ncbi:MAG: (d)CMP kinase [Proteobacteria bacterium]|nr:(d)CMP kinase [Pseudomonadota bacterium]MBU4288845.1 (d)CMP kinase [Pseudomonadota bacterium]MBU4413847.1 (d)CMP kinase [Pseudomonadota bacterium]MCG2757303.1 (d)CMP kinase [Desulfobacteraceae bacterium]
MKRLIITIDGPAGAGKTTVSREIADRLNYKYIDTGALYRGIAFEARYAGVGQDDDMGLENLCSTLNLNFVKDERGLRLLSNNSDITDQIRTPEISMLASAVSARPVVRKYLLDLQRSMGREKGVVFEGRDMGTVVFPDADMKFYLNASQKVRAIRRYRELESKSFQTLEEVEIEIGLRDENDRKREVAPMKPADDAVMIDSSYLSVNEVVEMMLSYISN